MAMLTSARPASCSEASHVYVVLNAGASEWLDEPGGGLDDGIGTCARSSGMLRRCASRDAVDAHACGQLTGLHGRRVSRGADKKAPTRGWLDGAKNAALDAPLITPTGMIVRQRRGAP